ncbi:MAG: sensor domain-containing diguanylate cyclase [Actinobacteria bacterium]|nr:sensor domain-containing diguanylate cyclase [Actinomycetota bacterium]
MSSSSSSARRSMAGATALTGRLRVLTVARLIAVLITVGLLSFAGMVEGTDVASDLLSLASAVYLVANLVVLVLLRVTPRAVRGLRDLTLVFDAAWGVLVLAASGGPFSPFIVLLYLQLVAVTVLFAWQTGVKLALAYTIGIAGLMLTGTSLGGEGANLYVAGVPVDVTTLVDDVDTDLVELVQGIFAIVTMWVMVGATAYFSSVNERDLRRSNRELAVLRELNTELERSLDLDDVTQAIAQGTVSELGYRRAVVWRASNGELRPGGSSGFDEDEVAFLETLQLSVGAGTVSEAVEARAPRLVAREDPRPAALADAFAIDSPLVLVPLSTEGRLLGLLTVEVAAPVGRSPKLKGRDLRILATLATEASLALDNARLHAELRDLSVTDALTGLYNHRYFQQRLQEELDRAVRKAAEDGPLAVSLFLMDIDFFKKVNDRFGHPSGDELLRSFAKLTLRVLRSSDVVCRYGGEEFAVILPDTDAEQAMQVAERLREAIERSNFTGSDGRYLGQVTSSFGVETYGSGLPSRSEMIQRADAALYEAKESGRNRVIHADDLGEVAASMHA